MHSKIPYANEIKLDSYVDRLVLLLTFFLPKRGKNRPAAFSVYRFWFISIVYKSMCDYLLKRIIT